MVCFVLSMRIALLSSIVGVGTASLSAHNFLAPGILVANEDLRQNLHDLLEVAHAGGNTPIAERLARIERNIAQSFQALPKNAIGRLAPRSVRHLVHNYFAKVHGWQIKGLEPQGMRTNVSDVFATGILQDKSPAMVEKLVEAHESDRGLALSDVAAMIAMLERLILDESANLLHAAYYLNEVSMGEQVEHLELHEILRSYLLLVEMGLRGNHTDIGLHQEIKERVAALGKGWPTLVEFETDAVNSYDFFMKDLNNPFVEQSFTFEAAAHVVDDLAEKYGKFQNAECSRMKDDLMALDDDGTGLIPLSTFYLRSDKREYQFTESVEYLREISAIDDSWQREPRVRISNYIAGPSNCIASSSYYSVCCLNECDGLLNELEGSIRAPSASPEQLVSLVGNMTSSSMSNPRRVSADLMSKLHSIAGRNGGEVPLHGRLFAQWLHHAFPYECPFPHISEDGSELSAHRWLGGKAIASVEVRADHVESVDTKMAEESAEEAVVPEVIQWSEEEVLPLLDRPHTAPSTRWGVPMRLAVQAAMFLVALRIVLGALSSITSMGSQETLKKGHVELEV